MKTHNRERRPPLLIERISAEQDEAEFFADHRPACAEPARGTAGAGVAAGHRPDRIENAPSHKADQRLEEQHQQHQRDNARGDRRKQVGAQPAQRPARHA
jgi:hypothetical protein